MTFDRLDCLVALEPFPQTLQVDSADSPGATARADHWIEVRVCRVDIQYITVEADAADQLLRVVAFALR